MSFLGDLFGGGAEKRAADANRGLASTYQTQGTGYINSGYDTARGDLTNALGAYAPLSALAQKFGGSIDTLNNAYGVNGAAGGQAAADAFRNSIYSNVSGKAGLDAINRRRAAAGMLDSGNADQDAQSFQTNLVNGQIGNWLSGLGGMSNNALSATSGAAGGQAGVYGGLGALATGRADDLTNLLGGATSANMSANNLQAQGEAAGARNLLGLGTSLLGIGTGGGNTVGGNLLSNIWRRS